MGNAKINTKEKKKAHPALGGAASQSTLSNKTGSWRVFRPIVTEKCTGCSICIDFCPDACIELADNPRNKTKKIAKIDYDYCKGCLICENVCPFKAIVNKKEKNEK